MVAGWIDQQIVCNVVLASREVLHEGERIIGEVVLEVGTSVFVVHAEGLAWIVIVGLSSGLIDGKRSEYGENKPGRHGCGQ